MKKLENQNIIEKKFKISTCDILIYQLPQQYKLKYSIIQTISTKCQYQIANTSRK